MMRCVYGPVASWRLGRSLGIDPISQPHKVCSFDCVYCQIGPTKVLTTERTIFIPTDKVITELKAVLARVTPDVITFSGMGEPTLASNLNELIDKIRELTSLPLAILTNSSLITDPQVYRALLKLDIVVFKLDAPNEPLFQQINRPAPGITLNEIITAIHSFRKEFKKKLALQMMFIDTNKPVAHDMAAIASKLEPDEVQLNTPLRPSPVKPLSPADITAIEYQFRDLPYISVYKRHAPEVSPINKLDVFLRRKVVE